MLAHVKLAQRYFSCLHDGASSTCVWGAGLDKNKYFSFHWIVFALWSKDLGFGENETIKKLRWTKIKSKILFSHRTEWNSKKPHWKRRMESRIKSAQAVTWLQSMGASRFQTQSASMVWSLIGLVGHLLHRQGHEYHLEPIPHFHVYTVGMRKQQKHSSILQTSCPLQNSVTSQRGDVLRLDLVGTSVDSIDQGIALRVFLRGFKCQDGCRGF